jgi:hypothetical protein
MKKLVIVEPEDVLVDLGHGQRWRFSSAAS